MGDADDDAAADDDDNAAAVFQAVGDLLAMEVEVALLVEVDESDAADVPVVE